MPGIYRAKMREGLRAIAKLHTVEYDLDRLLLHVHDLEVTLYRLATTIGTDKLFDLDAESLRAFPADEIDTHLGDHWTQAQLYAALVHAGELTAHVCPSCEGLGGEDSGGWRECIACGGTGEITERVTDGDRIRALFQAVAPRDRS